MIISAGLPDIEPTRAEELLVTRSSAAGSAIDHGDGVAVNTQRQGRHANAIIVLIGHIEPGPVQVLGGEHSTAAE